MFCAVHVSRALSRPVYLSVFSSLEHGTGSRTVCLVLVCEYLQRVNAGEHGQKHKLKPGEAAAEILINWTGQGIHHLLLQA